jgi:shikimate dehydrogenase
MSQHRVGLIGFPVEHSLSPAFQQAAFDALGIDARYELWNTPADEMTARVESLRDPATFGANVTVPHKHLAFELVDETTDLARWATAVNTIINRDGRLIGDNTDIHGFLAPLAERQIAVPEASVVVLGAGGAASGVVVALLTAGCSRITVANRTVARAEALRDALGAPIAVAPLSDAGALAERISGATLLVNTTAVGWDDDSLPLPEAALLALPRNAVVYDLTYRETGLLRFASHRGYGTIDGLPMLVHQGAASFRLWTGQEPPLDVMWQAAVDARAARS